jgi:hypothetical protein
LTQTAIFMARVTLSGARGLASAEGAATVDRMRRLIPVLVVACALACVSTSAATSSGVPPLLFPVVGPVTYTNDFGQARAGGTHQGNDLMGAKRSPVVAVEEGTVEFWTTSANAGCMLYLHGVSGTMYEYIHLNNDLTAGNDNKGKCVAGVSYAPGLVDGQHVDAGQFIAYLGDSGDANGIASHLHFEVHPKGGKAVSPFPYLKKAAQLLAPAPPSGMPFTLKLTGTVVAASPLDLTLTVTSTAAWPSHVKQTKLSRVVKLTATAPAVTVGQKVVVWTLPAPGTVAAISGAPGALTVDRVL